VPYIAIKGFPKDDETMRKVAERIERSEIVQSRGKMPICGSKWISVALPANLSPL